MTPNIDTAGLREFFDRLATGDYHALAKELGILPKVEAHPPTPAAPSESLVGPDGEMSLDSLDDASSFEPTVEGLEAAVALLRGPSSPSPSRHSPTGPNTIRGRRSAPEDDDAFQFTFRLMIHKLYSLHGFAEMVDDVVRVSQARFRPLPPALTSTTSTRRRASASFAVGADPLSDAASFASVSAGSPSETTLPSSPSLRSLSLDRTSEHEDETAQGLPDGARAVKKRCIGRKLSVVDGDGGGADERARGGAAWVYDAAVASVKEAPVEWASYAACVGGLRSASPAPEAPSRCGSGGAREDGGDVDPSSRKRRFSSLAARGL